LPTKKSAPEFFYQVSHYIAKFLNFMIAGRVIMMNDGSPSKQH